MKTFAFKELYEKGFITEAVFQHIFEKESNKYVPLHVELKALMYAGIILLTTGSGILVYKNIDNIGHLAIVLIIAVSMTLCFLYCFIKAPHFTTYKSINSGSINDYILLLGCLLLLLLAGYLQFQYNLFGERWGMATFVPMLILFTCAYYFDHPGVLSMAIVNLAAWAGISVTPKYLLRNNDFNNSSLIFTAVVLGLFLLFIAYISVRKNFKTHFCFTYKNFGVHILFAGTIAAVIHFREYELLWMALLAATGYLQFINARNQRSFYFLTIVTLYFYFGISYVIIRRLLSVSFVDGMLYASFLYFIITAVMCVALLMHFNKNFKSHEHI